MVDYQKMRKAVGELLTMLMTFKAQGDYQGIKQLVERHGIKFDPALRDEVLARVKARNLPIKVLMTSPRLTPVLDDKGALADVVISHDQGFLEQHLERSLLGRLPPAEATKVAVKVASSREALYEELRAFTLRTAPSRPVR